jgi:hypothetical protein
MASVYERAQRAQRQDALSAMIESVVLHMGHVQYSRQSLKLLCSMSKILLQTDNLLNYYFLLTILCNVFNHLWYVQCPKLNKNALNRGRLDLNKKKQ